MMLSSSDILAIFWRATWQAAILAALVFLLCKLFERSIPAAAKTLLWAIPIMRLLLLVVPVSSISIFNATEILTKEVTVTTTSQESSYQPSSRMADSQSLPKTVHAEELQLTSLANNASSVIASTPTTSTSAIEHLSHSLNMTDGVLAIWLLGTAVFLIRYCGAKFMLRKAIASGRVVPLNELLSTDTAADLRGQVPSHVRFIVVEDSLGPAVTGVLRPVVLLPQQMVERYSQGELKMVVMHELEHIQRHDTALLLLAQLATIVHWCNPLVYWLRRQLQAQAEIAVDAATLRKLGAEKVSQYAELLFRIASVNRTPANLLSMARKASTFRRRIELLAEFEHHTPLSKLIGVLAISGVALTGLSDATSQERPSKPSIEAAVAPAKDPTTESAQTSETNKPTDAPPTNKAPAVTEAQDAKPVEEQRREGEDTDKPANSELRKASGRVVDSQGKGVPNASLFCLSWTDGKSSNSQAMTDQKGDFTLMIPKKMDLFDSLDTWVFAKGFALRIVAFAAMKDAGDISGVSIPLPPVASKPTRVQVFDPNDAPVVGALVYPASIELPNGRFLADEPQGLITSIPQEILESLAVRTDNDGRATFDHFADGLWGGVACQSDQFGLQEYRRSPNELKLRLLPVGSLRGKIAAEDLAQFKNFRYSIETETILENGHEMRGVSSGVINDKGEFHVPAIAAGSIYSFSIGSANESTQDVELICDDYRSQTVAAYSTLELKLEAPTTVPVSGVVLTSDTRKPVKRRCHLLLAAQ